MSDNAGELMEQSPFTNSSGGYCVWEDPDKVFNVGIIGTGAGFTTVLDIIFEEEYQEFLPAMQLIAIAEPGPNKSKVKKAVERGVELYKTYEEMLDTHPEIDFVIELYESRFKLKKIRKTLRDDISLIDHTAAIFFCSMHNMFQSTEHCQFNLDRHRTLLQTIVDKVREDILLLDKDGRIVDVNKNVAQGIGKDKAELVGMPCWEVQTFDNGTMFCDDLDKNCPFRVTLESKEYAESMLSRVTSDGKLHYYRVYSYPIFNEKGSLSNVLIMRRDITSRTLQERNRQYAEKMAVIGEMSMYLAHEIRNPLFAIGGFTNSLLKSSNLDEKEKEKIKIISEETKRLDNMLTSILNFSKPTKSEVEVIEVNPLVEEVVELMSIGYTKQGYKISKSLTPDLPQIKVEPEKIKQCIINLIKNAIEAMESGGSIRVRTGMEKSQVFIEVEDNGRGMTEKEMENAFSPFFSTKERGYGMGLSMIKKIIEESHGHVELVSNENIGTTVTLFIPPVLAGGKPSHIVNVS